MPQQGKEKIRDKTRSIITERIKQKRQKSGKTNSLLINGAIFYVTAQIRPPDPQIGKLAGKK